jgi:hypothetical protein
MRGVELLYTCRVASGTTAGSVSLALLLSTSKPSSEDSQQDDGEFEPEISVHDALLGSGKESKSATRFAAVGWPGGPTMCGQARDSQRRIRLPNRAR